MNWEKSSMPPILPATDEEGLDRHRPSPAREREHVGVAEPFRMNGLAALDVGQRAQPVAIDRGQLEIALLSGLGHRSRQARQHSGRLAGEEFLRFPNQLTIFLATDPPDARRRAALDLVEQARTRSVGEKAVRTAS